jgi:membrane-bound metal-dependent hydrolase YbcI (DUF457 family)
LDCSRIVLERLGQEVERKKNRAEHIAGGMPVAVASAAIAARNQPPPYFVVESVVGGTLGGMLGIILPDIFEPATTPNHRGVAHAVVPMAAVGVALWKIAGNWQDRLRTKADEFKWRAANEPNDFLRFVYSIAEFVLRALSGAIAGVIGGYASHLALDAMTPAGLPWLARGM